MSRRYYASDIDIGFVNTWFVLAFPRYIENGSYAARKIRRREVTRYLTYGDGEYRPIPFSGDYWAVSDQGLTPELIEKYPGVLGVDLASSLGYPPDCEHFHNPNQRIRPT